MTESFSETLQPERTCAYRILRYTPNLVRDEWVNIGVLVYDPQSGERRLRVIEEQEEYARVRRLHPESDESLLRALRDDLEDRFDAARSISSDGTNGGGSNGKGLEELLRKWDDTLSNALQLAPQKGVISSDLDAELERLYGNHVARPRASARPEAARRCAPTARRSAARRACGAESRLLSALRNLRFPAIRCASTTVTAATVRAGSCRRSRSLARRAMPKCLPTPPSASPPGLRSRRNSPRSRMLRSRAKAIAPASSIARCATRASSPFPWITSRFGWQN